MSAASIIVQGTVKPDGTSKLGVDGKPVSGSEGFAERNGRTAQTTALASTAAQTRKATTARCMGAKGRGSRHRPPLRHLKSSTPQTSLGEGNPTVPVRHRAPWPIPSGSGSDAVHQTSPIAGTAS